MILILLQFLFEAPVLSRLFFSPSLFSVCKTVKGHVYPVWFQWHKLLMTSVPALFKVMIVVQERELVYFSRCAQGALTTFSNGSLGIQRQSPS